MACAKHIVRRAKAARTVRDSDIEEDRKLAKTQRHFEREAKRGLYEPDKHGRITLSPTPKDYARMARDIANIRRANANRGPVARRLDRFHEKHKNARATMAGGILGAYAGMRVGDAIYKRRSPLMGRAATRSEMMHSLGGAAVGALTGSVAGYYGLRRHG